MIFEHSSKHRKTLASVSAALLLAGAAYLLWSKFPVQPEAVYCTQEAKLCPDGSYVGRTGPNCEFAPCPDATSSWKAHTDPESGVSFRYPEALTAKYIHTVDWPPKVALTEGPFSCLEAGSEVLPAGRTERRTVDNKTYCVTKESEGAAGSVYTLYAYAAPRDGKVIIFTFSLRSVQCANYDDPQRTECAAEREAFDIDGVMDRIIRTVEFK